MTTKKINLNEFRQLVDDTSGWIICLDGDDFNILSDNVNTVTVIEAVSDDGGEDRISELAKGILTEVDKLNGNRFYFGGKLLICLHVPNSQPLLSSEQNHLQLLVDMLRSYAPNSDVKWGLATTTSSETRLTIAISFAELHEGDVVRILRGHLKGTEGRIVKVDGDLIEIHPTIKTDGAIFKVPVCHVAPQRNKSKNNLKRRDAVNRS